MGSSGHRCSAPAYSARAYRALLHIPAFVPGSCGENPRISLLPGYRTAETGVQNPVFLLLYLCSNGSSPARIAGFVRVSHEKYWHEHDAKTGIAAGIVILALALLVLALHLLPAAGTTAPAGGNAANPAGTGVQPHSMSTGTVQTPGISVTETQVVNCTGSETCPLPLLNQTS